MAPVLDNPAHRIRQRAFSEGGFAIDEQDLLERAGGEYARKARLQHEQPMLVGKAVSMRTDEYTYVYRLYESDELYDRGADPAETRNLIDRDDLAPVAAQMRDEILEWLFATADVIPWETDPRFPRVPNGQHEQFDGE